MVAIACLVRDALGIQGAKETVYAAASGLSVAVAVAVAVSSRE